jgi:hypothetical protein
MPAKPKTIPQGRASFAKTARIMSLIILIQSVVVILKRHATHSTWTSQAA